MLYPAGVVHKTCHHKVKESIEKKRKERVSDEAIEELVREKFSLSGGVFTYLFSTGKVYDKFQI